MVETVSSHMGDWDQMNHTSLGYMDHHFVNITITKIYKLESRDLL